MPKAKAIILDSDFTGEETDVKIKSGFCKIDIDKDNKREFYLDKSRPIKVKFTKPFGTEVHDFYFLSWKSLVPLEFEMDESEIDKNVLDKELKEKGITQDEIDKINAEIKKQEKKKGKDMKKFLYRELKPVVIGKDHWAKTELPTVIRETGEMRFLKQLKTYTEGGGGRGGLGKGIVLVFAVLFMAIIMIYSFASAGIFG